MHVSPAHEQFRMPVRLVAFTQAQLVALTELFETNRGAEVLTGFEQLQTSVHALVVTLVVTFLHRHEALGQTGG